MKKNSSRREFLRTTAAALGGLAVGEPTRKHLKAHAAPVVKKHRAIQKGLVIGMLPKELSYADRFKMARDVGFEVVQPMTASNQAEAEEILKAAEGAKIKIDSVMNADHWKYPLSSSDPEVVQKSVEGMVTSLHNARMWSADAVLLVPAVVNAQTSYRDAWTRSVQQIQGLLSTAAELKVAIDIEEVWNKFLLSPLEFVKYVDDFKSPWVRAWFDVGNVVLYGYPQDWIRTLGKRIDRIHLKDFKRRENGYEWVNLGDGDVDWAEVRKALHEIGFSGSAIVELDGGDEAYLRDVSMRVDKLLFGKG